MVVKLRYKLKRYHRLLKPSPAEKAFIYIWRDMGWYWRLRYKYKREYLVSGYSLDFGLPKERIDIEIDGSFHRDVVKQWEHDRRRDYRLEQKGWGILRLTAREVLYEPEKVKYILRYYMNHGKRPAKVPDKVLDRKA